LGAIGNARVIFGISGISAGRFEGLDRKGPVVEHAKMPGRCRSAETHAGEEIGAWPDSDLLPDAEGYGDDLSISQVYCSITSNQSFRWLS
jgi:hypothetical protein